MSAYNFESKANSATKLWHVTCRYLGIISCVQGLGGIALLKFEKAKNVQNSA